MLLLNLVANLLLMIWIVINDPLATEGRLLLLLLLLLVTVAVLISALRGYALSLARERRRVDPHWKRGLSFARIGLHWIQQSVVTGGRKLLAWMPIPLQALEPCIPSRGVRRRQKRPWFSRIELPPVPRSTAPMTIA